MTFPYKQRGSFEAPKLTEQIWAVIDNKDGRGIRVVPATATEKTGVVYLNSEYVRLSPEWIFHRCQKRLAKSAAITYLHQQIRGYEKILAVQQATVKALKRNIEDVENFA